MSTYQSTTFVTVVYQPELALLKLQAQSIATFCAETAVECVIVVANDIDTNYSTNYITEHILSEYGKFANRVRVLRRADFTSSTSLGWWIQQLLKLAIAREVQSNTYLVLDAKNHFIRPVDERVLFSDSGKLKSFRVIGHGNLDRYLINAMHYFRVNKTESETVMPTTTPYLLSTDVVVNMMREVERREGTRFDSAFLSWKQPMTEFSMYYAFLRSKLDLQDNIYCFGQPHAVATSGNWPSTYQDLAVLKRRVQAQSVYAFGLHRYTVEKMATAIHGDGDTELMEWLAAFWVERALFHDASSAHTYLRTLLDFGCRYKGR